MRHLIVNLHFVVFSSEKETLLRYELLIVCFLKLSFYFILEILDAFIVLSSSTRLVSFVVFWFESLLNNLLSTSEKSDKKLLKLT